MRAKFLLITLFFISITVAQAGTLTVEAVGPFQADVGSEDVQYYRITGSGFAPDQIIFIEVIEATGPFSIASDWTNFSSSDQIQAGSDGAVDVQVAIKYAPTASGSHEATIAHSAENTTTENLSVTGSTGTLPVELLYFTARTATDSVALRWATASERDNDRFDIELMKDLSTGFHKIGEVAAKNSGDSQVTSYQFDYSLKEQSNTWYVRLKQIDVNGAYKYSDIKAVQLPQQPEIKIAVLQAVGSTSRIQISAAEAGDIDIVVLDMNGMAIYDHSFDIEKGKNNLEISARNHIPNGWYIIIAAFKGTYKRMKILM